MIKQHPLILPNIKSPSEQLRLCLPSKTDQRRRCLGLKGEGVPEEFQVTF